MFWYVLKKFLIFQIVVPSYLPQEEVQSRKAEELIFEKNISNPQNSFFAYLTFNLVIKIGNIFQLIIGWKDLWLIFLTKNEYLKKEKI
jgi:hypothetical protein